MDEFELIDSFFNTNIVERPEVQLGIGDDCAVLSIPVDTDLLISTDTLVSGIHFLPDWDPGDIAYKAVMVNISDCIAMGGTPVAITLALTLPAYSESWLSAFSKGLHAALQHYQIALIGGDTTRGPLSVTITIHGSTPQGCAVTRAGANIGDRIYVTGQLGLAAFAVATFEAGSSPTQFNRADYLNHQRETLLSLPLEQLSDDALMKRCLHYPQPRCDWVESIRHFATAAIDLSDGLSSDLNHLCQRSRVGAKLILEQLPIHPLLTKYTQDGLRYALEGGDDYELCFTVSAQREKEFLDEIHLKNMCCYCIGVIEKEKGMRAIDLQGKTIHLAPQGYRHF